MRLYSTRTRLHLLPTLSLSIIGLANPTSALVTPSSSSSSFSAPRPSSTAVPSTPQELTTYAAHWDDLLHLEHENTVRDLRARRKTWSRGRLESSGTSLFDAVATPDGELLGGEKVLRVVVHHGGGGKRLASGGKKGRGAGQLFDRFARGDVLVVTVVERTTTGVVLPREGLVIDVGGDWLTLAVGLSWPSGVWEGRKGVDGGVRVRLDRTVSTAPLRAQRSALERVRRGDAGEVVSLMARTFYVGGDNGGGEFGDGDNDLGGGRPVHFRDLGGEAVNDEIGKAIKKAEDVTLFRPNESQKDAISWALKRTIALIRGPPGTGKTKTAALLISTALKLKFASTDDVDPQQEHQPINRVLAVTHSNGAADVLLEALLQMKVPAVRLGRPASVSPSVQHRTIVAIAEKIPQLVTLRQRISDTSLDSQSRSAAAFDAKQYLIQVQDVIRNTAPVVVTSCIGAHQLLTATETSMPQSSFSSAFPLVVLDEAAQTTEPALLCALAAAKARQVVLVGDTQQLPPTITSTELRDSLGVSPMARLEALKATGHIVTLRYQYRMPPALLAHPSRYFYDGLVVCATRVEKNADTSSSSSPPKGFSWPSPGYGALAFVHAGEDCEVAHEFGSKSNPTEAALVVDIVTKILDARDVAAENIAIISPYAKQVQFIRTELLNGRRRDTRNVRVGTVDSYQGQETDVVIFSAVRSNPVGELGFLRDSRRLCVAITRARRGLILVGDRSVLRTCRHWAALLEFCREKGCFVDAEDLMTPGRFLREEALVSKSAPDELLQGDLLDKDDDLYGLFN